jgi:UTP-glucose-1-phosphate uridylyltransferase
MTDEDPDDELIANMFDEVKEVRVQMLNRKPHVRTADTDFVKACKRFVAAHKTFEYWDRKPDKYTDKAVRLQWWDALAELSDTEQIVKCGFIGEHSDPASNQQYVQFREVLLAGRTTKANA